MAQSIYDADLGKTKANFQALTPLSFLERTASIHPDQTAIIHGKMRRTYQRVLRPCAAACIGVEARSASGPGDTVSAMLANTPEMLEAHFGVPMTGAVLHTINTRLDAAIIAFQLDHAESKILFTDREFAPVMAEALKLAKVKPVVIDVDDLEFPQTGARLVRMSTKPLSRRRCR